MSELKTLKDLNFRTHTSRYPNQELKNFTLIYDLKEEAIKLIKAIQLRKKYSEELGTTEVRSKERIRAINLYTEIDKVININLDDCENGCNEGFIKWIKHFFNITEGDLK